MIDALKSAARAAVPVPGGELVPSPFLHAGDVAIYNPLTDRHLGAADADYPSLRSLMAGEVAPAALDSAVRERLSSAGWLHPSGDFAGLSEQFHLKYVSLEAHTVCNQGCYFCPVAYDPREAHFMPTELYEDIVRQLAAHRDTIEAVFMINYNEPTADKRFVDQVRLLKESGLPPATLTNGTGLTPARVDQLVEMGGLKYLSINLSTLDPERYRNDRKGDHLELVLKNLDYAMDKPVGETMEVIVLGKEDAVHLADHAAIEERFRGSRFVVKRYPVMDRAGYLQIGLSARHKTLCGCDNVGSRPLQHLHITPQGRCVLCCEDYDEGHVVGDLTRQTVDEVLRGPELALYRRWIYGIERAPDDFMCRNCVFARTR